jgi:hypothetical protein
LQDIRAIFQKIDANGNVAGWHDKIYTRDLIAQITAASDSPWREFQNGKCITEPQLAKELRKFKIKPGDGPDWRNNRQGLQTRAVR